MTPGYTYFIFLSCSSCSWYGVSQGNYQDGSFWTSPTMDSNYDMYMDVYGISCSQMNLIIPKGYLAPPEYPDCVDYLVFSGGNGGCTSAYQTEFVILQPLNMLLLCAVDIVNKNLQDTTTTIQVVIYESTSNISTSSYKL